LLERYRAIFRKAYAEDRALAYKRGVYGFGLGLLGTVALYAAYAWTALATVRGELTLGDMTMYLLVFKQGQSTWTSALRGIGGLYEDNLYLSNLYEFLEQPKRTIGGAAREGTRPGDGLRLEHVSFTYAGASAPAIDD